MQLHPAPSALAPLVRTMWISNTAPGPPGQREHVLPDGHMHLAIRLEGGPVRLYDEAGALCSRTVSDAVVAGPYSRFYLKEASGTARSLGVVLRPGAARALFGCDPAELHNRHWPLQDLWPGDGERLRDRLHSESDPGRQLACLQAMLLARLRPCRGLHPQAARALQGLRDGRGVGELVAASGYSHRRFIDLFRTATGMTPKTHGRLLRFRRALAHAQDQAPWARVALEAGYSDQAHFIREFRAFTGMTPQAYRRAERRQGRHVRPRAER